MPFWRSRKCNDWFPQHNNNQHHSTAAMVLPGKIRQTSLYMFAVVPGIIAVVSMITVAAQQGAHSGQKTLPFVVPEYDCTNKTVIYNTTMFALDGALEASRNRLYIALSIVFFYSLAVSILMKNHEDVVRDYAAGTELSGQVGTIDTTVVRDNFDIDSDDDRSVDFGI